MCVWDGGGEVCVWDGGERWGCGGWGGEGCVWGEVSVCGVDMSVERDVCGGYSNCVCLLWQV